MKKRGRVYLISFGVSSSSYFFFSFFRKTSQMINMTMRTPRDTPTIAPAILPTLLTSVNGKKKELSDGSYSRSSVTCYSHLSFFIFNPQILIFHVCFSAPYICATEPKFNLTLSNCWAAICVILSAHDPDRPGSLRKCISVTVKHNCWWIGGDQ